MDKITLKALKESIEHHRQNLEYAKMERFYLIRIDSIACSLCIIFSRDCTDTNNGSSKCPIYEKTWCRRCSSTPWVEVSIALSVIMHTDTLSEDFQARKQNLIDALKSEIDFLVGLLPENG